MRDLDGSGMVRGVVSGSTVSGVGDVFVMKMYFTELGEYHMINHVLEYEPDRGHPIAEPGAELGGWPENEPGLGPPGAVPADHAAMGGHACAPRLGACYQLGRHRAGTN
jgi:hypothetical protein